MIELKMYAIAIGSGVLAYSANLLLPERSGVFKVATATAISAVVTYVAFFLLYDDRQRGALYMVGWLWLVILTAGIVAIFDVVRRKLTRY